jgi:hypothetical protein
MVEKPLPACVSIRLFIVASMFTDYSTANMTAFFNTHHQTEFTAFVIRTYHGRRNFKDTTPLMSSLLIIFVWGVEATL